MNYLYAALATILLLIGDFAAGYYFRGQHDTAKVEKTEIKSDQTQMQQEAKQLTTNQAAEAVHDADLQTINLTVTRTPIVLRGGSCPAVPLPASPGDTHPTSGGTDQGPGVDIRPAVEAFERKYETVLADCRRLQAEWPTP